MTWPSNLWMLPNTQGLPSISQTSLMRYLVEKLSEPSMTRSKPSIKSRALTTPSLASYASIVTSGFRSFRRRSAEITFASPTADVPCRTCLCRFERSTESSSMIPILPIPAAARYSRAGEPSPPAPTTRIEASFRSLCPSGPTSGRDKCLA